MPMNRLLINYLPSFMQEYLEMQKIMEVQQPEIDLLWAKIENALAEQFISDATEHGVQRWEKIINVFPKRSDTLADRKFRILTKLNIQLPHTVRSLEQTLTTLCGEGNYTVEVSIENYHIEVRIPLKSESSYQEVVNLLKNTIPANMTQHVQIIFNDHALLSRYTHEQMSHFTHKQLRNEVLH